MKIAVNLLYLESNTRSGIGKHIEDILIGLEKMAVLDEFYLLVRQAFYDDYLCPAGLPRLFKDAHVIVCDEGPLFKAFLRICPKGKALARDVYLNHLAMPRALKKLGIDMVFHPFNATPANFSLSCPFVVVIHDLFYKNFPGRSKTMYAKFYAVYVDLKHRVMVKRARKIVAISDYVKADILRHFPHVDGNRIVVIPNSVAVSAELSELEMQKRPFLLCVSEHGIHKNHITLLKAFNLIKGKISHQLVLLGRKREETLSIQQYIDANGLRDRVDFLGHITDSQRNWLYKNTDLLISPSLHEGFGRTPVEAAMLGAMVLTTRETSLPEITCDLLNYYEPARDETILAERIMELLARPVSVAERARIAQTFIRLYDPCRVAGMYYDLFKETSGFIG